MITLSLIIVTNILTAYITIKLMKRKFARVLQDILEH